MPYVKRDDSLGYIYCLLEPDSDVIRYVGQTKCIGGIPARITAHMSSSRVRKETTHLLTWLRKLDREGKRPRGQLLAKLPYDKLDESEVYWIAYMRSIGCDLVNSAIGGTGGPTRLGMKTPRETAMKQGAAWLGRKHREESKEKIRAKRAEDRQSPRSCIVCREVFFGYLALRNHQVKHQTTKKKVSPRSVQPSVLIV